MHELQNVFSKIVPASLDFFLFCRIYFSLVFLFHLVFVIYNFFYQILFSYYCKHTKTVNTKRPTKPLQNCKNERLFTPTYKHSHTYTYIYQITSKLNYKHKQNIFFLFLNFFLPINIHIHTHDTLFW